MRPTDLLASALLFSSASNAWPSGWDQALEVAQQEIAPLFKRAASTSFNLSFSATQGNTAPTPTATESDATITGTSGSATGTASGDNSDSASGTGTITGSSSDGKETGTATSDNGNKTTAFDPRLPPGGVSMITPNPLTSTFYKIDNYVTFAWNYTSVSILPSAIDILAVGSQTGVGVGPAPTYTLALNQSVNGNQGSFTWDTNGYQQSASTSLRTNWYTLVIHDAAKDVSATPSPGYLGTADQFVFGMYLPSPYTALDDNWKCATCNGAMTSAERQTLVAIFGMAGITVLSFGWFTGVAGLW